MLTVVYFLGFSEDSQLPILVETGAVPCVPDREDAVGSVVVQPPVLGPQEQVTLSSKTSSNLHTNTIIPDRCKCVKQKR